MPVGFGVATETARSVVKNFKRQRKNFNSSEETLIRIGDKLSSKSDISIANKEQLFQESTQLLTWRSSNSRNKALLMDLSNPFKRELIDYTPQQSAYRTDYLDVRCGIYRILACKENHNNLYNFSFCIRVGKSYVYSAENIKAHIIEQFNEDVYIDWKKHLKETYYQAELCVQSARLITKRVIASPISSKSSRRFCKRSGLFVSNDEAFLLPMKYQY